jgi:MEMO1 family protein
MKPKLRELNVHPVEQGFALSDPLGISAEVLVLSPQALQLAGMLDGSRDLADIQAEILRASGQLIPKSTLEELAQALEKAGFLENEAFLDKLRATERAFLQGAKRAMALADHSYPQDPEAFKAFIEVFRAAAPASSAPREPRALIMPHLEPRRVPEIYGAVLEALASVRAPERVLVVGVAHQPLQAPAAALPLPFETPLGDVAVDFAALGTLNALLDFELFNTPLAFKEEHSLEFPIVFLKAAWPEADFSVIPLLVHAEERRSLQALAEALGLLQRDYPSLIVASVDLSHVGYRFGEKPFDRELARTAERTDRDYLDLLAQGAFEAAFEHVVGRSNRTRIDASAAVYALKEVLPQAGAILAYKLSPEPETLSAVGAGALVYS